MGIRNFFIKSWIFLLTIKLVKNWQQPIIHYIKNKEKIELVKFRNNLKCFIRNKSDAIAFFEIFILKSNNNLKNFEIKETDTVVDIGAHVGYFTIYAGKVANKGQIYSFEPFKDSFKMLRKNVEINQFQNIVVENLAVMKKRGISTLYIDEKSIGNSMFNKNSKSSIDVKTISVKDIFETYNLKKIDFLKLDCEGAEFEIILNLTKDELKRIKKISAEIHPNIENFKIEDIKKFLRANNFSVQTKYLLSGKAENLPMLYAQNET